MIFNMLSGGGASIDAVTGTSLPSAVVNDQIYIIPVLTPTTIYVDTDTPAFPVSGDVCVVVAAGGAGGITFTDKTPIFRNGFKEVKQYINSTWLDITAYLGVSGSWVQLSSGLPAHDTALNDISWTDINIISTKGLATTYFEVGDTKNVSINGTTYVVEIVGFSHDDKADGSGKAGITFGLKDCLNTTYAMNSSNTNVGGWGSCALRSTLRSTIYNQLPSDLREVIKNVTKKASAGNNSTTISSYTDNLFLFAEKEIFGSTTYSVNGEGTQYARFTTSSTRIKKVNGSAAYWWLRSPFSGYSNYFCRVISDGTANYSYASRSYGVAFGFCI